MHTCRKCKKNSTEVPFYTARTYTIKGRDYTYPITECKNCALDRLRHKTYGLTGEEYRAMSEAQGGVCLFCLRPPKPPRNNLDVDHDHVTGKVRGLLCSGCNRMLGRVSDNPEILRRALAYLESHAT